MLLEHERDYGLGMDAMVTVCSWNTNEIMVDYGLGMDAMVTVCSWNTNEIMVLYPPTPPHPRCKNLFNHTASYRRRLQKQDVQEHIYLLVPSPRRSVFTVGPAVKHWKVKAKECIGQLLCKYLANTGPDTADLS